MDEMRMPAKALYLVRPLAGKQVVYKVGHITDIHFPITIDIGILGVERRLAASQQVVNETGHIADVYLTVAIGITLEALSQ